VVVVWYVFLTVLVLSGCCEYLFVMYYVFLISGGLLAVFVLCVRVVF